MVEVQQLTDKRLSLQKINNRLTARLHNLEQHSQYDALDIHGVLNCQMKIYAQLFRKKMNAFINNTYFDEVTLNTLIDVKTELEESIPEETECLFSQYVEDMEYDCGIDHNKLYTVFPIKEENDPLSLDKNCNCEGLMFIKKEEQYQIKPEELVVYLKI